MSRPVTLSSHDLGPFFGPSHASLGPRFETMPPVNVFTGGADPALPGQGGAAPAAASPAGGGAVDIPLPRPRPAYPAGQASLAAQ